MFKKLKIRNLKYPTSFHDSMNEPIHSAFKLTAKWNLKKGIWKENSDEWKTIIPPPPLPHLDHIINKYSKVSKSEAIIHSTNPVSNPNPVTQFQPPFTEPHEQRASFPFPLETISFATFMPHTISNSLHLDGVKRAKERREKERGGGEGNETDYTRSFIFLHPLH